MSVPVPSNHYLKELVAWGTTLLEVAGVASAQADTIAIIADVLELSNGEVRARAILGDELAEPSFLRAVSLLERRAAREPLQYILGKAYFRSLTLAVGPGVFVPRPETESLVSLVLADLPAAGSLVDLGTGSGAIALSVATERPDVTVTAIEQNTPAFSWAQRNLAGLGLANVHLVQGSFHEAGLVTAAVGEAVDVVVSNPPYVPSTMPAGDPEVRNWDPASALYSGHDGLDDIRIISRTSPSYLRSGGRLWLEHAEHQGAAIRALLAADHWHDPRTETDLTGRDRFTCATWI